MELTLVNGTTTLVDDDATWVLQHRWYEMSRGKYSSYVMRSEYGTKRTVYLHREVLERSGEDLTEWHVDHINGDSLDNRLVNLRRANRSQNLSNSDVTVGSSIYKGVCWDKRKGKWMGRLGHKFLGYFLTEVEAARAYDTTALRVRGRFARINGV